MFQLNPLGSTKHDSFAHDHIAMFSFIQTFCRLNGNGEVERIIYNNPVRDTVPVDSSS